MATRAHTTFTPALRRTRPAAAAAALDRRSTTAGPQHVREVLEGIVARALAMLDALDADSDLEPGVDGEAGHEGCCAAADDDLTSSPPRQRGFDRAPGTPEDGEAEADEASLHAAIMVPDRVPARRVTSFRGLH